MNVIDSLTHLWVFYVLAYAIALSVQTWANHKRGAPFDDPEFLFRGKKIVTIAMIWLFGGFFISLFVPLTFGPLFFVGLGFYIVGIVIGISALYSFAHHPGLVTTGIHRYSRNPIYVGWAIVIFGMALMGWSASIWGALFLVYFVVTIPYFHWTVLLEEEFLVGKYRDSYRDYLSHSPRYFGIR